MVSCCFWFGLVIRTHAIVRKADLQRNHRRRRAATTKQKIVEIAKPALMRRIARASALSP